MTSNPRTVYEEALDEWLPRSWKRYRSVRNAGRQRYIGKPWRDRVNAGAEYAAADEEVSLCSHPQDPQVGQPVTGQAHTRRVERGVLAMETAVRQRSSGTMESRRSCNMLPRLPRRRQPWPYPPETAAARSLRDGGLAASRAIGSRQLILAACCRRARRASGPQGDGGTALSDGDTLAATLPEGVAASRESQRRHASIPSPSAPGTRSTIVVRV